MPLPDFNLVWCGNSFVQGFDADLGGISPLNAPAVVAALRPSWTNTNLGFGNATLDQLIGDATHKLAVVLPANKSTTKINVAVVVEVVDQMDDVFVGTANTPTAVNDTLDRLDSCASIAHQQGFFFVTSTLWPITDPPTPESDRTAVYSGMRGARRANYDELADPNLDSNWVIGNSFYSSGNIHLSGSGYYHWATAHLFLALLRLQAAVTPRVGVLSRR